MNQHYAVIKSADRLYKDDTQVNHPCHAKLKCVHDELFISNEWDETVMHPIIINGVASMKSKLSSYAQNQLPGGIYWDPDPKVKVILEEVNPSNDLCESILGLNNYLNTTIPNMHQVKQSNLHSPIIEKQNHSMTTAVITAVTTASANDIIDLAVASRREAFTSRKEDDAKICKQRRENMLQSHRRLMVHRYKEQTEKHALLNEYFITSSEE